MAGPSPGAASCPRADGHRVSRRWWVSRRGRASEREVRGRGDGSPVCCVWARAQRRSQWVGTQTAQTESRGERIPARGRMPDSDQTGRNAHDFTPEEDCQPAADAATVPSCWKRLQGNCVVHFGSVASLSPSWATDGTRKHAHTGPPAHCHHRRAHPPDSNGVFWPADPVRRWGTQEAGLFNAHTSRALRLRASMWTCWASACLATLCSHIQRAHLHSTCSLDWTRSLSIPATKT